MVIAIFHCCLETNLTEGLGQLKKKKKRKGRQLTGSLRRAGYSWSWGCVLSNRDYLKKKNKYVNFKRNKKVLYYHLHIPSSSDPTTVLVKFEIFSVF